VVPIADALLTGFSFGNGRWVDSGLLPWIGYRWWRVRTIKSQHILA
jgi:hypothetical protein